MRNVWIMLLGVAGFSSPLLAGVETELQTGRRWAETKSDGETNGVQMDEVLVAARYGILDSGFSVGPTFSYSKFHDNDLGDGAKASNYELGLEAKYAYQVLPWLTPYAKARYVGYSHGTIKLDDSDAKGSVNFRTEGAHLGLGAAFAVAPMVQITAEVGYGIEMIRTTGGKLDKAYDSNGAVVPLTEDQKKIRGSNRDDFNSKSFMLGVNVALQ